MKSLFEAFMLISFGAAWPASIYKSYKSRTAKGKSLAFMLIVLFGYGCGIISKFLGGVDYVLIFYIIDCLMVSIDLCLYFRNRKIEKLENQA